MRSLAWLLALALVFAGCAPAEEPYPIRPPGSGGSPGHGGGDPDAAPPDGDAAPELTGRICVVLDLTRPFACPAVAARQDVRVEVAGGDATRSDAAGEFALPAPAGPVVLRVADEAGDGLVTTLVRVDAAAAPVDAPAVDDVLWEATLAALQETQTLGALLVYVVDDTGAPVGGARVAHAGAPVEAGWYGDDGAGGFVLGDADGATTGPDGVVLVLDAPGGVLGAREGERTATATLATADGAIGLGVIELPSP
jgi:hypothetical protein